MQLLEITPPTDIHERKFEGMYLSQKENEPIWKSEEHEAMMNTFINMSVTLSKHCVQF